MSTENQTESCNGPNFVASGLIGGCGYNIFDTTNNVKVGVMTTDNCQVDISAMFGLRKTSIFRMVNIGSTGLSKYYFKPKNILPQSPYFAGLAPFYTYTQEPQFHYIPKCIVMFIPKSTYAINPFPMCISSIICSYYCNYAIRCVL